MTEQCSSPDAGRARVGRRTLLKASVAGAAAPLVLTPRKTEAQLPPVLPPSPPTTPWVEELPRYDAPVTALDTLEPFPSLPGNTAGGEVGRVEHQRYFDICGPGSRSGKDAVFHKLIAKVNPSWRFNGDNAYYPPQPIWGFQGTNNTAAVTPGPTIHAHYGQPILCRIYNELPASHAGFGSPEIITHLHNMHTPSESDGFTGDFYSATVKGPTAGSTGSYRDHFWPNLYAGIDEFGGIGDPREALGSLWYHDHTEGVTAPNTLRGLVGRYNVYDALDSGSEESGLRLPSGHYDYPLTFADRRFDVNGQLTFDQLNPEGVLGDKILVNGRIEPVLRVTRRRYRFRLLNAGPTRYLEFVLQNRSANALYPFTYIANDGNLLPSPLTNQFSIRCAPAERADIVIDFAKFPLGTELYLVNLLQQTSTRRPDQSKAPGTRLLKIIVDRNLPAGEYDRSMVPAMLRPMRPLPSAAELAALPVRRFNFERSGGMWAVNGRFFNVFQPVASIAEGRAEIWELFNVDNGWQHPVHIHFEEGVILSKRANGVNVPIPPHERGRKDVFNVGENMTVRVLMRFRDFKGKYLMHCHNLTHEDHSMMVRFDIV